jgi:hypothetical protein
VLMIDVNLALLPARADIGKPPLDYEIANFPQLEAVLIEIREKIMKVVAIGRERLFDKNRAQRVEIALKNGNLDGGRNRSWSRARVPVGSRPMALANSTICLMSNFLWPPGVFWHFNVPSSDHLLTVVSVTLKRRAMSAVERRVFCMI